MDNGMDGLAKALATGGSRRELFRMLSRTAVGGALVSFAAACRDAAGATSSHQRGVASQPDVDVSGGKKVCDCPCGLVSCGGVCTLLALDPLNCGACGSRCASGHICVGGVCTSVTGGSCPPGLILCNGVCTATATDPNHCGGCGRACGSGMTCASGVCLCPPGSRPVSAGGGCCIMPGAPCSSTLGALPCCGGTCLGGKCAGCPPGSVLCNGVCVDTSIDPKHCGGCGSACGPGMTCVSGVCACPAGSRRNTLPGGGCCVSQGAPCSTGLGALPCCASGAGRSGVCAGGTCA